MKPKRLLLRPMPFLVASLIAIGSVVPGNVHASSDRVWVVKDVSNVGSCMIAVSRVPVTPGSIPTNATPCPANEVHLYEADLVPLADAVAQHLAHVPMDAPFSAVRALEHAEFDRAQPSGLLPSANQSSGISPMVTCSPAAGTYYPVVWKTLGDGDTVEFGFEYQIRSTDCFRQAVYAATWWDSGATNSLFTTDAVVYPKGDPNHTLEYTNGMECVVINSSGNVSSGNFPTTWLNVISLTIEEDYKACQPALALRTHTP